MNNTYVELWIKKVKIKRKFLKLQPGDVKATFADVDDLKRAVDFNPSTSIEDGLRKFVDWYKEYYKNHCIL